MNTTRDQMLQRIREAVIQGNRAGAGTCPIPERGQIGHQGAGTDPIAHFRETFVAAGGQLHVVADLAAAVDVVLDLVRARAIRRVLRGHGDILSTMPMMDPLRKAGVEIVDVSERLPRDEWFTADMGLSGVDFLIAETGSVVLASRREQPRSISLLPTLHVAVAERRQIVADLFDLFPAHEPRAEDLPSCLSIITGPSKTGDIELRLVTGVHGPGEIHVVLITGPESQQG